MKKESYEVRIKKNGVQSLNIEEIRDYKKSLQEKAAEIRKKIHSDKLLCATFGTMGVVSQAAVVNIVIDYCNKSLPKAAALGIGIPFSALAAVTFVGVGAALQDIETSKKNKTNTEDEIVLLDEEVIRRTK